MINPTKNGKELVKICRGGQTIWQKPKAHAVLNNLGIGHRIITGKACPNDATIEIKVERSGQVIFTGTPKLLALEFEQVLKFDLKEDDEVTIRVTAPYFAPYEQREIIY